MSNPNITPEDAQMLNQIRVIADDLARRVQEAGQRGFTINYCINGITGSVDRFDVYRMVPVDLRGSAH